MDRSKVRRKQAIDHLVAQQAAIADQADQNAPRATCRHHIEEAGMEQRFALPLQFDMPEVGMCVEESLKIIPR
ncbi:hypothetical protein ACFB49_11920 [Sphingomonas sp. DBB INV C78]